MRSFSTPCNHQNDNKNPFPYIFQVRRAALQHQLESENAALERELLESDKAIYIQRTWSHKLIKDCKCIYYLQYGLDNHNKYQAIYKKIQWILIKPLLYKFMFSYLHVSVLYMCISNKLFSWKDTKVWDVDVCPH